MILNNLKFSIYSDNRACNVRKNSYNATTSLAPLKCDTVNFSHKSKVSFTSQALFDVKIKHIVAEGVEELIPAKITKFIRGNPEDIGAMRHIKEDWPKANRGSESSYEQDIFDSFINGEDESMSDFECIHEYYALELADLTKALKDRVLCLAQASSTRNDCYVRYLQSHPFAIQGKSTRNYKGSGEVLLYGICKDQKNRSVSLPSTNDTFYKHIGMTKHRLFSELFIFKNAKKQEFIDRVEKKYDMGQK